MVIVFSSFVGRGTTVETEWLRPDICNTCQEGDGLSMCRWHYGYKPTIYYPKPTKSDLYEVTFPCVGYDGLIILEITGSIEKFTDSVCGGF